MEKRCGHCKETKDAAAFGQNRSTKDGLNSWCKSCTRAWNSSPERRAYKSRWHREWRHTPEYQEKWGAYFKSEHHRKLSAARSRRQQLAHPEKKSAGDAVYYAVKAGKLPHPKSLQCAHCDEPATAYHHALGYARENRLMVEPICQACHDVFRTKH